jgi:hypothetical protein
VIKLRQESTLCKKVHYAQVPEFLQSQLLCLFVLFVVVKKLCLFTFLQGRAHVYSWVFNWIPIIFDKKNCMYSVYQAYIPKQTKKIACVLINSSPLRQKAHLPPLPEGPNGPNLNSTHHQPIWPSLIQSNRSPSTLIRSRRGSPSPSRHAVTASGVGGC